MRPHFIFVIHYAFYAALYCVAPIALASDTKLPLAPEACTEVRYLAPDEITSRPTLRLSHDGKQVAYVLQVPNLASDEYRDELFVARFDGTTHPNPAPILVNVLVAAITWFPDSRHLAALIRLHGRIVLVRVDSVTAAYEIMEEVKGDITDYSMDSLGNTIAVAVRLSTHQTQGTHTLTDNRKGYRLSLDSVAPPDYPRRRIYLLRRGNFRHWEMSPPLSFVSPLSGKLLTTLIDNHSLHVSMSPNGRYLVLDNLERFSDIALKGAWEHSRVVTYLAGRVDVMRVSYLYDLQTKTVSMPLESPSVMDGTWSPDSKSYAKVALSPVGSRWEEADLVNSAPSGHSFHLFSVDIHTGAITEILQRAERAPLAWTKDGDLVVQDRSGAIHSLSMKSNTWTVTDSFQIPLSDRSPYTPITTDGQRFVVEYENASTAPELLQFDRSSGQVETLAKLNPQVDGLLLPKHEDITWTTPTGYKAKGIVLLPPNYDPGRRYPLVIENGSILYDGEFVCDSGIDHVSSFARGILADSGIIYLMRYWPGNDDWKNNYYPKGYPGEIGEAAFQLDLVESAIHYLDSRHMIDPARVGLIGFSRGGWYTEYALAHSYIHFQAATATDNIQYSLGEYWYLYGDAEIHGQEGMYGGPPYGSSLKNWLDYSISFNLDKINTPLLMEVMGYGRTNDDPNRPLNNVAVHNEVFVGLSRLSKPVELYYYPEEQHQMDHPVARIAASQRNVDWYRFWLQGYERPNPGDPDQYRRWEHLRELRDADYKAAGIPIPK